MVQADRRAGRSSIGRRGKNMTSAVHRLYPLDFWLSLLAGEQVWQDEDARPAPLVRLDLARRGDLLRVDRQLDLAGATSPRTRPRPVRSRLRAGRRHDAALTLCSRPLGLLGGQPRPANFAWSIVWRSVAVAVLTVALIVNVPRFGGFALLPLGMVFGFEAAIDRLVARHRRSGPSAGPSTSSSRRSTSASSSARWLRRPPVSRGVALWVLHLIVVSCVGMGWATAATVDSLRELQRAEDLRLVHATRRPPAPPGRALAARRRVGADRAGQAEAARRSARPEDVVRGLDELDHQIRLRQLEELYQSGDVRLAEVLQPYVRRAQNQQVAIERVPTFDDASLMVDVEVGRLFGRAAAVLTSNAMNAGATRVAFDVAPQRRRDLAHGDRRRGRLPARRCSVRARPVVAPAGARPRLADGRPGRFRERRHRDVASTRESGPCPPS